MRSKRCGNVKAISSKCRWNVNFSKQCNSAVGNYLRSPKFVASNVSGTIQWHLIMYPRGVTAEYRNYMSLYLFTDTIIQASCDLNLLNKKNEVVLSYTLEPSVFGKNAWGFNKFVTTDFITNPANDILANGLLTILFEITTMPRYIIKDLTVPYEEVEKQVETQDAGALSRLEVLDGYGDLLNDNKFSDVSLISEGKTLKVHKCILAKNSTVFAAMFDVKMESQEDTLKIVVNDIRYMVLEEMIRFIYTGKINKIDELVGELIIAAKKYELQRLLKVCKDAMIQNLNTNNVINFLLLAHNLKINELKTKATEFIIKNASVVTKKREFRLLPNKIVCEVCCRLAKKK